MKEIWIIARKELLSFAGLVFAENVLAKRNIIG